LQERTKPPTCYSGREGEGTHVSICNTAKWIVGIGEGARGNASRELRRIWIGSGCTCPGGVNVVVEASGAHALISYTLLPPLSLVICFSFLLEIVWVVLFSSGGMEAVLTWDRCPLMLENWGRSGTYLLQSVIYFVTNSTLFACIDLNASDWASSRIKGDTRKRWAACAMPARLRGRSIIWILLFLPAQTRHREGWYGQRLHELEFCGRRGFRRAIPRRAVGEAGCSMATGWLLTPLLQKIPTLKEPQESEHKTTRVLCNYSTTSTWALWFLYIPNVRAKWWV